MQELREELTAGRDGAERAFEVQPLALRLPEGLGSDDVEGLIEALEGPLHK